MDEGDTKGTFGKPPRNWNGISRFVEHSDVAKGSLTGSKFEAHGAQTASSNPLIAIFPAASL